MFFQVNLSYAKMNIMIDWVYISLVAVGLIVSIAILIKVNRRNKA